MTIAGIILIMFIGLFLMFGIKTKISPWKHAEGNSLKVARFLGLIGFLLSIVLIFNLQ